MTLKQRVVSHGLDLEGLECAPSTHEFVNVRVGVTQRTVAKPCPALGMQSVGEGCGAVVI